LRITIPAIPETCKAWLNVVLTAGISGGALALTNFFQSGFDITKIDFHRMAQVAGMGAIVAILNHLRTPPAAAPPAATPPATLTPPTVISVSPTTDPSREIGQAPGKIGEG